MTDKLLLEVRGLSKSYGDSSSLSGQIPVLKGIDFKVDHNETIGLVGISGAGKSTIGRIIAGLESANRGEILYEGQDILRLKGARRSAATSSIQMIFQDPYESLSPRMTIGELVAEPLVIQKTFKREKEQLLRLVSEALSEVSLSPERYLHRYPHELSGGERQRVGLARAFICKPKLIIADEPTSMLDSSLRLDLLELMDQLRKKHQTSTLFITHDLALTYHFCDRLIVLDQGVIVESGSPKEVIDNPQHPFTRSLISALMELNHL
ncbi:dipeptide/oligopeptide/nickel ABC transporter ATP-binding protein [Paenibacillus sp. FSL H8-0548]|uniref:ABC transporter ATP-binding protein n=1 Tax=Paenibacillus sp. FSL H8-0548 TaxID=1920422 RepID=UPI00096C0AD0|nr:ABC transporter ATP-binding protein [Paenibacillus sp. FSL H8-0548]OMF37592.1 dipeptide/oligopeptide/nickel ABC transporter ATP-binding protein [Paenibacillus sp. FSL H8-0548]